MNKRQNFALHRQGLQDQMEREFMNAPNASLSTSYSVDLQTQEYRPPKASHETVINPFSVVDRDFSWLREAVQQLREVYEEVLEACTLDSETDPVPGAAYYDAFWLLKLLDYYNVPMPDIGWLIDGGIGFEWRSTEGKGIGTMSIYGDNHVVYGASLESSRKVKGTCELTDLVLYVRFFPMLKDLCSQ